MLNGERRQDVGLKMVYVILTAIITLLMATFFNKTYNISEAALAMGNDNRKDIAVQKECIETIKLSLIKMDLKLDNILLKK